jgi:hypothetical protein
MQIARFDFSYLDQQLHQTSIDNLRKASKATRTLCATMMDTLGPEIVVTNRYVRIGRAARYSVAAACLLFCSHNHCAIAVQLLCAFSSTPILQCATAEVLKRMPNVRHTFWVFACELFACEL